MSFSLVLAPSPPLVLQVAAMGVQGARGLQGIKGDTGDKGDNGDKGDMGDPGNDAVMAWHSVNLGADIVLPTSNVWVEVAQFALVAGVWLVMGTATFVRNTNLTVQYNARLRAGATTIGSTQKFMPAQIGAASSLPLQGVINLAEPATCRLEVATSAGSPSQLVVAATPALPSGNNATKLTAVRLA